LEVYEISKHVFPTEPSPTTTHLMSFVSAAMVSPQQVVAVVVVVVVVVGLG